MEEKKKNKEIITASLVLLLVVVIVGVSYAAFTFSKTGVTENAITTSAVTMIYTEGDNQITINNAVPITEEIGKTLNDENYIFDFTVDIKTGPKMPISYEVTAEKDTSSTMGNNDVRLYLQKSLDGTNYNEEVLSPSYYMPIDTTDDFGAKAGEMIMDVGTVSEKVTYYYRLRMWVDSNYQISNISKSFTIKVNVYGKTGGYIPKDRSGANAPELVGDMIPVVYDESSNSWKKSSTSRGLWYNYDEQKWANAVTIKDNTKRELYKSAAVETPINIEDINTFMVWIPRYGYALGNTYGYQIEGASTPSKETPGAFDIKFVDKNTIEMGSGKYIGNTSENYFTPSSFCWGDTCDDETTRKDTANKELAGIWVSKFQLTGTINNISSLPNSVALSGQSIYSFFSGIQNILNGEKGLSNYGLSGNYDTHMIKNTEWGAFTYLSQSKYGKYGNSKYEGINKEIAINNCSNYITGIGGDTVSAGTSSTSCTTNTYETEKGQAASTTGNIYGIYDTSGGIMEYVMGNYSDNISLSEFTTMPKKRYYNLYTGTIGIKGDATNADGTNGFYQDLESFVKDSNPWVTRSGSPTFNLMAGPFLFNGSYGSSAAYSSHFVLTKW